MNPYRAEGAADHAPTEAEAAFVDAPANGEQRFRLAFENNMAGTILVDPRDKVLEVNDAVCEMVGRDRDEIVGKDSEPFTHPEDRSISYEAHRRLTTGEVDKLSYTKRYLHENGRVIDAEVSKSSVRDASGSTRYFVISIRDITKQRALNAQLSYQALHDSLTGLANRVLFEDRLSQAHTRTARRGGWNAVMLLDLDDFKEVNDTLGHIVGDELLVALARRFEKVTRSTDTLCRFGGDEFTYLAAELVSPAQAEEVAERLLGVLAKPFSLMGPRSNSTRASGSWCSRGRARPGPISSGTPTPPCTRPSARERASTSCSPPRCVSKRSCLAGCRVTRARGWHRRPLTPLLFGVGRIRLGQAPLLIGMS